LYYVHRPLDGDRIQRDQMSGPNDRDWVNVIDKADEARPNELALSGSFTGRASGRDLDSKPNHGIWRIEPNRFVIWESTLDGQKIITDGRNIASGTQLPWVSRCGN
jgi:hypothetical protein